ncbi:hypothetical protein MPER_04545, partial [Moniliophthora perniciosa FA553]
PSTPNETAYKPKAVFESQRARSVLPADSQNFGFGADGQNATVLDSASWGDGRDRVNVIDVVLAPSDDNIRVQTVDRRIPKYTATVDRVPSYCDVSGEDVVR